MSSIDLFFIYRSLSTCFLLLQTRLAHTKLPNCASTGQGKKQIGGVYVCAPETRKKKETYLLLQGVVQGGKLIDLDLLALLVLSLLVAELTQTLAERSSGVRLGLASDRGNSLTDSVLLKPNKRKKTSLVRRVCHGRQ